MILLSFLGLTEYVSDLIVNYNTKLSRQLL